MTTNAVARASARLGEQALLDMFWMMLLSRRLDERAWALHRQGKIAFHISAHGARSRAGRRGVRHQPRRRLRPPLLPRSGAVTGAWDHADRFHAEPVRQNRRIQQQRRGRCRATSVTNRSNIVSGSSPVATQVPQAAGLAFAIKYRQQTGLVDPDDTTQPRLALTSLGEGSTSQGEWHEGMNWAGVHKLPLICLVQNNIYAISVPVASQMAVDNVADRAAAYGIDGVVVDGNDVLAVYDVMAEAVERAYNGDGATLVEAKTYRIVPHSSDDDDRSYRSREEVEAWKQKGPINRFRRLSGSRRHPHAGTAGRVRSARPRRGRSGAGRRRSRARSRTGRRARRRVRAAGG